MTRRFRRIHVGVVVVLWAVSLPEVRGQPPQARASTATIVIRGSNVAQLDGPKFPITLRHSGGQSTVERPDAALEAGVAIHGLRDGRFSVGVTRDKRIVLRGRR
jgi:hypothetical protein